MGRKAEYQASARLLWGISKLLDDARVLTRSSDEEARERFKELEEAVNNLAVDLYWDRTYKKSEND